MAHGRVANLDNMENQSCKVKDLIDFEGWVNFFVLTPPKVYEDIVCMFYANLHSPKSDKIESLVLGQRIVLDCSTFNYVMAQLPPELRWNLTLLQQSYNSKTFE